MTVHICDRCKATVREVGTRYYEVPYPLPAGMRLHEVFNYADPEEGRRYGGGNTLASTYGEAGKFELCFPCLREWNTRFRAFMAERGGVAGSPLGAIAEGRPSSPA